jgi:hypothetical protein
LASPMPSFSDDGQRVTIRRAFASSESERAAIATRARRALSHKASVDGQ